MHILVAGSDVFADLNTHLIKNVFRKIPRSYSTKIEKVLKYWIYYYYIMNINPND